MNDEKRKEFERLERLWREKKRYEKLAWRLSERMVRIKNEPSGQAYTDGSIIALPIDNTVKVYSQDDLLGLTSHESFHIRAHSFAKVLDNISEKLSLKHNVIVSIAHEIVNITEDYRINTWLKRSYEGFYGFLVNLADEDFNFALKEKPDLKLVKQLFGIYSHKSKEIHEKIKNSNLIKNLNSFTVKELEEEMKKLRKNPSPEYGAIAADNLCKIYTRLRKDKIEENKEENTKDRYRGREGRRPETEQGVDSSEMNTNPDKTRVEPDYWNPKESNLEKKINDTIDRILSSYVKQSEVDKIIEDAQKIALKEIDELKTSKTIIKQNDYEFESKSGATCKIITNKEEIKNNSHKLTKKTNTIISENKGIIKRLMRTLMLKTEKSFNTRGYSTGRMNRDIIKTIASDYEFKNCYSKVETLGKGKIDILMDLSGSMRGPRIQALKRSVIIITEALKNTTDIRIVGFAGTSYANYNIIFKDFNDPIDNKMLDAIDTTSIAGGTPTGCAIESEMRWLEKHEPDFKKKMPILLITDGRPDNSKHAIEMIGKARQKANIFGIGIEYSGKLMEDMFGQNCVLVGNISELNGKLIQIAKKIVRKF